MRITVILPGLSIGGGTRAIFKHAELLRKRGHSVNLVYPVVPSTKGLSRKDTKWFVKSTLINLTLGKCINLFGHDTVVYKIPFLHEVFIPDADVIIATQWTTAYFVKTLCGRKGKALYFIQGYETFLGPVELVESTYRFPLKKVVVAQRLKEMLRKNFGEDSSLVMNGVDLDDFYNNGTYQKDNIKRVLMVYHSNPIKGISDGIEAFKRVKEELNDLDLVMFGAWKGRDVPGWVEFHENPSPEEIRGLYCTSDAFVCSSRMEGFALPPMEAMACKIPTVLTNVGAIPEYTIAGKTTLMSEPGDVGSLAENLYKILTDVELATSIAEAGYEHIKQFSWESSNKALEEILQGLV